MNADRKSWNFGDARFEWGRRTYLMGVLNATPDSFSDGGKFTGINALVRIARMDAKGADMIDIGGESTRPGFDAVPEEEEIVRVTPLIENALAADPKLIFSVDTSKAAVARSALKAGARIVNDVHGFRKDLELAEVVAESGACCVLMFNGREGWASPKTLDAIRKGWDCSVSIAIESGVPEGRIALDPGIGFGTTREQDVEMLRGVATLKAYGFPLLIGASRKRVTGEPFGLPIDQRLETTLTTTAAAIQGGADIIRVHDVSPNARAARMADLIWR